MRTLIVCVSPGAHQLPNSKPVKLGEHPHPILCVYCALYLELTMVILQHSYLRNIAAFLLACKKHFNLQDLFVESDLYEVDNFKKVMQVLSRLSHSPEALSLGWV